MLADRAFARASGSDPIDGNAVRLLRDAAENFPAWLDAIRGAKHSIFFEMYIFGDDAVGREFAEALAERAQAGVEVYVVYDWFGSLGAGPLWKILIAAGAQVRSFNPLRFDSPLGWLTRDHRKTIVVDGRVAFVSGLCVSARWNGDPGRGMEPWRDTGVEIRGPAVAEIGQAFAQVWLAAGGGALRNELRTFRGLDRAAGRYADQGDRGCTERHGNLPARSRDRLVRPPAFVADRCVLRRYRRLCAGARRGGARRCRRPIDGPRRQRHSGTVAVVARRLSAAAAGRCAGVRVERNHAACEERGRRRPLDAYRVDQSQHRELDGQLRARRRHRGRRIRIGDGHAVRESISSARRKSC